MRWFNCKKEEFVSLECINVKTDKHILRLSPNGNFIPEDENKDENLSFDLKKVSICNLA